MKDERRKTAGQRLSVYSQVDGEAPRWHRQDGADLPPVANRRYSSLKSCATPAAADEFRLAWLRRVRLPGWATSLPC
jgi:hypothetical protein